MTIDAPESPGSAEVAAKRGSRVPWIMAIAVVAVLAALTGGLIASRGDDSSGLDPALGTQQLASIQQACAQWHDGYAGAYAPASGWCDDMVGWMTDQTNSRQMMGSMMWGDPGQLLATCQQWVTSSGRANGSTADGSAWCGQMVTWMTEHMGNWDQWDRGWMMNGPMMGR